MSKHSKKSSSLLHYPVLVVFSLFFVGLFALDLITPDRAYSEMENTTLSQRPALTQLSAKGLNSYFTAYTKYVKDQVFGRDQWISLQSVVETTLLQKEQNGGILLGKEHMMFPRTFGLLDSETRTLPKNTAAVESLCQRYPGKVNVLLAPAASDIYKENVPANAPLLDEDTYLDRLSAAVQAAGGRFVDVRQVLAAHKSEYIYYRTDHHWTTLGAYYAYCEIMKSFDMEPYPLEHFTREIVSEEFYGTTWSKAGMKWIKPDEMEYFRWDGDTDMVTEITDTGRMIDGMYDLERLGVKDKYSSFIGGNNGYVKIYPKEGTALAAEKREKLILIKDSFGHSVAPFLAEHFDLEILDLRYYKLQVIDFVAESDADKLLVLVNADSLVTSNSLAMLNLGLGGN